MKWKHRREEKEAEKQKQKQTQNKQKLNKTNQPKPKPNQTKKHQPSFIHSKYMIYTGLTKKIQTNKTNKQQKTLD